MKQIDELEVLIYTGTELFHFLQLIEILILFGQRKQLRSQDSVLKLRFNVVFYLLINLLYLHVVLRVFMDYFEKLLDIYYLLKCKL